MFRFKPSKSRRFCIYNSVSFMSIARGVGLGRPERRSLSDLKLAGNRLAKAFPSLYQVNLLGKHRWHGKGSLYFTIQSLL